MNRSTLTIMIALVLPYQADAEVYKCIIDGKSTYQASPCSTGIQEKPIKSKNDVDHKKAVSPQTYRDTQGYKDYLKLPPQYHSPEAEKSFEEGYNARRSVENLPCKKGGTIKTCLDAKTALVAVHDLGWNSIPYQGAFYVERILEVGNLTVKYRWFVDRSGIAKPDNGHAIGLSTE